MPYTLSVSRIDVEPCVRDLGTLGGSVSRVSGQGTIVKDPGCVSVLRDPGSGDTYFAHRWTFTLEEGYALSFGRGANGGHVRLLMTDNDMGGASGTVLHQDGVSDTLVGAGTYTIEVTRVDPGSGIYYSFTVRRDLVRRRVALTAGSAVEGDAAVVFTLAAVLPVDAGPVVHVSPISVRWATVSGTAAPGSDYTSLSGSVLIPADRSHATVIVPLTDDSTAETIESFSLRLTQPSGATLVDTSAVATITDDDGPTSDLSPITPCGNVVLSGSVVDVFDIAQSGYAADSHVFVDVGVTCGDGGSPVGLPVAVEVVDGDASALGGSRLCVVERAAVRVTSSVASAQGCLTFAVSADAGVGQSGRSTPIAARMRCG